MAFGQESVVGKHFPRTVDGDVKAWIFFKDKGAVDLLKNAALSAYVSQRSLERRLRRAPQTALPRYGDYPVNLDYLERLRPLVKKIRVKSRWLNAVSAELPESNLEQIAGLPFVRKVQPVAAYFPHRPIEEQAEQIPKVAIIDDTNDYGPSFDQLDLIKIPELHKMGLDGQGVLICMLDDGFNLLNMHIAFDSLDVVATRDFIDKDNDVTNSGLKATIGWHGTRTLSILGGYVPGELIGPAYRASFILGRTELDQDEIPTEEDYWVAGLEWADSMGADLVSSSLGYIDWYTWMDMDGETAVTTVAADSAVERGMLIFNSAGNEGDNPDHNTLIAPADGDNVLAIAAVDKYGLRASFSSVGPTADGRIKPDLAAMGSGVYTATSNDSLGFVYGNGTSFSCPLAAGAAALLLQAFPETTPEMMHQALRSTASRAEFPDKYLGWGIIDIKAAYNYLDSLIGQPVDTSKVSYYLTIWQNSPNPATNTTKIKVQVKYSSLVGIQIYNLLGEEVLWLDTRVIREKEIGVFTLDVSRLAAGVYIYQVRAAIPGTGQLFRVAKKLTVVH